MKTAQALRKELEEAYPHQFPFTCPIDERKLFGLDSKGQEIRAGSMIKFSQFGKEKTDIVRCVIMPEYRFDDGQILYPQREVWHAGPWPLGDLILNTCEVIGNASAQ